MPPPVLLLHLARQLDVDAGAFAAYARRDQTRRAHFAELARWIGLRAFDRAAFSSLCPKLTRIKARRTRPSHAPHESPARNTGSLGWHAERHREIRSQFHRVIDVAPTILEAAGLPEPVSVNGVQQKPIEGVSMLYSFSDASAGERHETQYFEMFGNRRIPPLHC